MKTLNLLLLITPLTLFSCEQPTLKHRQAAFITKIQQEHKKKCSFCSIPLNYALPCPRCKETLYCGTYCLAKDEKHLNCASKEKGDS